MSHSASKSWVSAETKEFDKWNKIRDKITHISPHSPFAPRIFADWLAHRVAMKENQLQKVTNKIAKVSERIEAEETLILPVLRGKTLEDRLALVLARETIWRSSLESFPGRDLAPWPSYEEFKHEGDDRNRSGFRRFLPLPRDSSNETVSWKQRKPLNQFFFDRVGIKLKQEHGEGEELEGVDECFGTQLIGAALLLCLVE
ncbi:hypothetical protein LOZ39_004305 [Ophidiomyces ophidiicola]|uniref:uncharacterized protein n=1 Tax=Ophidiomyces ophidiicola TaxID=1387563 RepID=UPI0020C1BE6D|nr:uncharacterized protein LOZ57_004592 [Ophidiomyces ophidiicola]KAI1912654.1 hypothetical protein LOZ64_004364 [Ophidiomyces ophidiicola]KAI1944919.1 hypothetical protein LOZ57_004592 [Ophidiomyces ophidiicola]KAI2007462.1 hypothetical protein LOZ50_002562 [Ophidiomyces ophidiicola]KAI2011937.1 hypothetical protein LOZ49_002883 [Ophidiomyces ophidiicola]KAI2019514.1 hypothetical protein LOZ46_003339 [Ophidiomyces ophidiicola]